MYITTCTRNAHHFTKEFVVTKEEQTKCFLPRRKIIEIKSYYQIWYLNDICFYVFSFF